MFAGLGQTLMNGLSTIGTGLKNIGGKAFDAAKGGLDGIFGSIFQQILQPLLGGLMQKLFGFGGDSHASSMSRGNIDEAKEKLSKTNEKLYEDITDSNKRKKLDAQNKAIVNKTEELAHQSRSLALSLTTTEHLAGINDSTIQSKLMDGVDSSDPSQAAVRIRQNLANLTVAEEQKLTKHVAKSLRSKASPSAHEQQLIKIFEGGQGINVTALGSYITPPPEGSGVKFNFETAVNSNFTTDEARVIAGELEQFTTVSTELNALNTELYAMSNTPLPNNSRRGGLSPSAIDPRNGVDFSIRDTDGIQVAVAPSRNSTLTSNSNGTYTLRSGNPLSHA